MSTGTLLQHTYARQKYPHICTLSISTTKKSECESIVIIYISIDQYKYIVIKEHDIILHQYHIIKRRKSMIYNIRRLRDAHELQNGVASQRKRRQIGDDLQLIYQASIMLRISTEGSTTFHNLGTKHAGPGLSRSNLAST